ncbi:universal stress protein [Candidatus Nitrotoga sp. 1052]|uniref:universal stress protein n=1 Tax=Candidatus Nitrotoga sp. 1052 TaxID=2886964 RepID=UPI001EF4D381|nr:universal stress protein [Candidatus Nitrotoga sp. 1052]CAH1075970.1 Usp domain-containing protein [Candidatus Nitrotoga sp. 1052]
MNPQKIVIAMPTEEEFMPSISRWGHEYVWTKREIYFVHVIKKDISVSEMGVEEIPDKLTVENLKQQMLDFFKNKAREMMPELAFTKAHFEVLFAQSPAERIAEYAKEINAGMIVVATRNKRGFSGLFLSSFADRILKLSPCDVLVLRPK